MQLLDNLSIEENEAIEELRARFKNALSSEIYNDTILFYRFLKARDFDVDKAETMLKKNLAWRKAFQVDNILETFQPREVFKKYVSINFIGFDKEGNSIHYCPFGNVDARDLQKCFKHNDLLKHYIWIAEYCVRRVNKENERTGRKAYQDIPIIDLDRVLFDNLTSKAAIDEFLRITCQLQDNYPERLKSVYVINAPTYFKIIFSVIKTVMSNAMLQKIQVFGRDGWKESLRKVVKLDDLPAFLGGNLTDPDGNPLCKTILNFGGTIPSKYYLSPEERTFKDKNQVKKLHTLPGTNFKIPTEVQVLGAVIQCEFEITGKDIGFGLFFQKSEDKLEDVLPIQRFVTTDGTGTVSFKSQSMGTYVIIFNNSHSWFNSKNVHYCITVQKP